jgi:tRNA G46 methylase TrmB
MAKRALLIGLLGMLLAACGTTAPERLDAQMGTSVEMAVARQTLNPQAARDEQPVGGIDGKTADALVDRYHKTFEKPTTVNIFNIGVGSGGSTLGTSSGAGR